MKSSWEEIIASDSDYIDLIWYGSIMNITSHEGEISQTNTVIVSWFQRVYNLKMVPDSINDSTLEAFRKKYWEKYGIYSFEQVKELQKEKVCVLNCMYTGKPENIVNGVLIRITRKDFETYQKREAIYDLYETQYSTINAKCGEILQESQRGYILSAQEEYIINDGHAFLPYHNFSRNGAYEFWDYFWEMFDETTYQVDKK